MSELPHPRLYSIKRHGTSLDDCDAEPVQTPGCIQNHGALLVLKPEGLVILQTTENAQAWLGLPVEELLNQPLEKLLSPARLAHFRKVIADNIVGKHPYYLFTVSGQEAPFRATLDVIVHKSGNEFILEFESTEMTPGFTEPDYYALLKMTMAQFEASSSIKSLCDTLVSEIQRITDFDRVMIYWFHADYSGEVLAEVKRDHMISWLNWRYPAHDIPRPAREIFKKIWVRPVPDVSAGLQELVPLANPLNDQPLDMTHCVLRGASVMYTEYLQNMGVRAALTLPIIREGELWGLIACHHESPRYIPYKYRAACEFLAKMASLQLMETEKREFLEYQNRIAQTHFDLLSKGGDEADLSFLTMGFPSLLQGISSEGVAIFCKGRWYCAGETPRPEELPPLVDWLQTLPAAKVRPLMETDSLPNQYSPAISFSRYASGLLALPFSDDNKHWVLWFRQETIQTFSWSGNPYELSAKGGPHGSRLTPRKSFELWKETVHNRSLPWKQVEKEAAVRFGNLLFDYVSRVERTSSLKQMMAELESVSYSISHDMRQPLRSLQQYSQILMEDYGPKLDAEAQSYLQRIVSSSSRMDRLIQDVLTYSRIGRHHNYGAVDLHKVVTEIVSQYASLSEPDATITVQGQLQPIWAVEGLVTQIVSNLLGNAVKFIAPGIKPQVYVWTEDAGRFIRLCVRDNGIGIEEAYNHKIWNVFERIHQESEYDGTGIGLSIVKKAVERLNGKVGLDSAVGKGSTFWIDFPRTE